MNDNWIPVTKQLPDDDKQWILVAHWDAELKLFGDHDLLLWGDLKYLIGAKKWYTHWKAIQPPLTNQL